jgi:hypothetical protein
MPPRPPHEKGMFIKMTKENTNDRKHRGVYTEQHKNKG